MDDQTMKRFSEMGGRLDALTRSDKSLLKKLTSEILNEEFKQTRCPDCWKDQYFRIRAAIKNADKADDGRKYTFTGRSGFRWNGAVVDGYSDDSTIEQFLKAFPHLRKFFKESTEHAGQ